MNATQKQILKDATKIVKALRKLDMHREAEQLNLRVAKMIEDAA
jgi:hypothetical protein